LRLVATFSLLVALLPATAGASTRTAHVYATSLSPVSVRGTSFRANERVAVTVSAKTTRTKTATAGVRGNFAVTFKAVSIGRCQPYTIRAKGNRGSTALLRVLPECAPEGPTPDVLYPSDPIPKKP
jgi:hypothetical protein